MSTRLYGRVKTSEAKEKRREREREKGWERGRIGGSAAATQR